MSKVIMMILIAVKYKFKINEIKGEKKKQKKKYHPKMFPLMRPEYEIYA